MAMSLVLRPNEDTYDIIINDYIIIVTTSNVTIGLIYVMIDSRSEEVINTTIAYRLNDSLSRMGTSVEMLHCEEVNDMRIYYHVIDEFTIRVDLELRSIFETIMTTLELNNDIDV